jgi:glycosyltransferase involved in cell wall biosynthesis
VAPEGTDSGQRVLVHVTTVGQSLGFFRGQPAVMKAHGLTTVYVSSPDALFEKYTSEEGVRGYGVPMHRGISPLNDMVAIFRLVRLFRRLRPTIVDVHTPKAALVGAIASWLVRTPVRVYHLHGLVLEGSRGVRRLILTLTERLVCALSHEVICVSPSLRAEAIRLRLGPAEKFVVLANGTVNGIDTKHLDPDEEELSKDRARRRIGLGDSESVVGFLGRIADDKGVSELAEAWRSIRNQVPNAHLVFIGGPDPAPPPPDVMASLRQDPRVHFCDHVDDPALYYAAFDVLAMPSRREGFGLAAAEAGAMQVPAVTTRVTGCVDAVADGLTGTVVPPRDPAALAQALIGYLTDDEHRRAHGMQARARAEQCFDQHVVREALATEYARLLHEHAQ